MRSRNLERNGRFRNSKTVMAKTFLKSPTAYLPTTHSTLCFQPGSRQFSERFLEWTRLTKEVVNFDGKTLRSSADEKEKKSNSYDRFLGKYYNLY
jgi:hypothetical protein